MACRWDLMLSLHSLVHGSLYRLSIPIFLYIILLSFFFCHWFLKGFKFRCSKKILFWASPTIICFKFLFCYPDLQKIYYIGWSVFVCGSWSVLFLLMHLIWFWRKKMHLIIDFFFYNLWWSLFIRNHALNFLLKIKFWWSKPTKSCTLYIFHFSITNA